MNANPPSYIESVNNKNISEGIKEIFNAVMIDKNITLTEEQLIVLTSITRWVLAPIETRERIIHVSGPAGTGKTLCIEFLVKFFKEYKLPYQVATPTHKACKVLRRRVNGVVTMHKLFMLVMHYDEDGNLATTVQKEEPVHDAFVVLDEASMISDVLYLNMLNSGQFFVCFGDSAQLPPVENGKLQSIVYDKHPIIHNLTQVIRNTEPTLIGLRDLILTHRLSSVNSEDVLVDLQSPKITFVDKKELVKLYINSLVEDKIILCYRNKTCEEMNTAIRKRLFASSNSLSEYCIGEKIIWTQYYSKGEGDLMVCKYTSDTDVVEKVEIISTVCKYTNREYKLWKLTIEADKMVIFKVHSSSTKIFYRDYADKRTAILKRPRNERSELWKEYYQTKFTFNAPINYNYSITIHSAQGSEYEHVFVREDDFAWLGNITKKKGDDGKWSVAMTEQEKIITRLNYLKLLYVGVSRMKDNCTIGVIAD